MHFVLAFLLAFQPLSAQDPVLEATIEAVDPAPAPALVALPTVYVRVIDWRHMDRRDVVGPACAHLQITCKASTYTTGTITIVLTDPFPSVSIGFPINNTVLGVSSGTACEGRVWAINSVQVVAHEMGHALGLDHVPIEGNLLYPSRDKGGMDLTDDQRRAIKHGARVMRACA